MNQDQLDLKERIKVVSLFQRFVLGRYSQNVRQKCYEGLILWALLDSSREHPLSSTEVVKKIQKLLQAADQIPDGVISKAFQNLKKTMKIETGDERYWIRQKTAQRLHKQLDRQEEEGSLFYEEIARSIVEKAGAPDHVEIGEIRELVKTCIAKIFEQRGLEVVQPLLIGRPGASAADFDINKLLVHVSFASLKSAQVVAAAQDQIGRLFSDPSKKEAEFLYALSKSYVVLQALNLDPSCSRFQRSVLTEYTLFIDSSVLLCAIARGSHFHAFYDTFLRTCAKLHTQIYITKALFGEVLHNLEAGVQLYPWLTGSRLLMQEYLGRSERDRNIFIDSFITLSEQEKNPPSWHEYVYDLYSHDDPEKIIKAMYTKYKIRVFDSEAALQDNDRKYVAYVSRLITQGRIREGRHRPEILAENEAQQFMLVYSLRRAEKRGAHGKLTWFVTTDSVVPRVNLLLRKEDKQFVVPCSYTPTKWYQFIEVFARTERKPEVFVELLGSSMMRSIAPTINEDLYQKLTEGRIPKTKEGYERLVGIVNEVANTQHVKLGYEEYLGSIPSERLQRYETYSSLAIDQFSYLISQEFKEVEHKESRIQELEAKIFELESKLKRKRKYERGRQKRKGLGEKKGRKRSRR
ncbi:MAG: hypothetical protein WBF13_01495 [Candidatus Zixiibacteriota bacterium]